MLHYSLCACSINRVFFFFFLKHPDIFFCRSLPAAYITEYLFHQEHLSFIRFFHHVTLNFFHNHAITFPLAAPPPSPVNPACTNKWCVFTRTSCELLRIHADRSLQKYLSAPLYTSPPFLSSPLYSILIFFSLFLECSSLHLKM